MEIDDKNSYYNEEYFTLRTLPDFALIDNEIINNLNPLPELACALTKIDHYL